MMRRMQQPGSGQRVVIFILLMVGGLLLIGAITVFLILLSFNAASRPTGIGLQPEVVVSPFATLPDDRAYPAALTVAPDGTIYTASYATGAIWSITPEGVVTEIPGTRDALGSVAGLAAAADSTLLVIDRVTEDPRGSGGQIWRLSPAEGDLTPFAAIPAVNGEPGFLSPVDLTIDAAGQVYVVDRGRHEIWRWSNDGSDGVRFWTPPDETALPTGIAYEPLTDSLLVTDTELNLVYRVPLDGSPATEIYRYTSAITPPTLDGVAVAPDGTIYLTALEQNGVVTLRDGDIAYIAGNFRGPSDLEFSPDGTRLYVTNFDSTALVMPGINPMLPFALDVITWVEVPATEEPVGTGTAATSQP